MTAATRPYFVPEDLDFEALPEAVKVAVNELVTPAYKELVLQPHSALERAAGASYVHLLFLELLEQFGVGRWLRLGGGIRETGGAHISKSSIQLTVGSAAAISAGTRNWRQRSASTSTRFRRRTGSDCAYDDRKPFSGGS